jgi:thiamine kinase-like enzyme
VLEALAALHAKWWQSPELAAKSWLQLRAMVAPEALAPVFAESWPSFLSKLSDPSNPDIVGMGRWIDRELDRAAHVLFGEEPRTLVHDDVQGDNLFFDDAEGPVALVDWQLRTYARAVLDVATLIRGQLDPPIRRRHERHLVQDYRNALVKRGVSDYPPEQCWVDYQLATVIQPARIASAVGLHSGLQAHPGAFWDVLFPRYAP